MFKFTFSTGSGIFNPFAVKAEEEDGFQQPVAPQTINRKLPAPPKRTLPPPSVSDGIQPSRKRGWTPAASSASAATSQLTLTNGWIDTPSRYLEAASQSHRGGGEDDNDLPPAKRRKTLTDTIISTAFSAALIGTAVGVSAYRMWRDRGKSTCEDRSVPAEPPPPYEREEWVDDVPESKPTSRTPRLPRKPRSVTRRAPRRRMGPITISPCRSRSPMPVPSPSKLAFQPEVNQEDEDGLEQQIDWMGDRIRNLIEEGQKALGKEVVVMNDDENNEEGVVDDGMDGWEEEGNLAGGPSSFTSAGDHRPRRPRQGLDISASPPSRSAFALPASCSRSPTSPRFKRSRSRTVTNGRFSQGSSASTSPHLNVPSPRRLGVRSFDGQEDFKVIYEPAPAFPDSYNQHDGSFQDEDSRGLSERMENIRKAYRIH